MVSTSRYRLSVRRFIFELFEITLDKDTVQQLDECARALVPSQTKPPASAGRRRAMSVLFAAPKAHASESDEEEDGGAKSHRPGGKKANATPAVCLNPHTVIRGFEGDTKG